MAQGDLQRSESTTTSTDLEKENASLRHVNIPECIPEADESDNVGYAEYKEGMQHSEITPAQNRSILWKIDLIILPIFLVTQTLNFLDVSPREICNRSVSLNKF